MDIIYCGKFAFQLSLYNSTIRLDLKKNNSEVFLLNERERIKFGDRAIETSEERERERQRNSERETETERIN